MPSLRLGTRRTTATDPRNYEIEPAEEAEEVVEVSYTDPEEQFINEIRKRLGYVSDDELTKDEE